MRGTVGLLLAALALTGAAPGCSPGGDVVCTQIGCDSGLGVELRAGALEAVDGPFTVRVCADGDCTESEQPGGPTASTVYVFHVLPDARAGADTSVRVEVADRDGIAFAATRTARFRADRPNGPRCPPVCNQAHLRFGG